VCECVGTAGKGREGKGWEAIAGRRSQSVEAFLWLVVGFGWLALVWFGCFLLGSVFGYSPFLRSFVRSPFAIRRSSVRRSPFAVRCAVWVFLCSRHDQSRSSLCGCVVLCCGWSCGRVVVWLCGLRDDVCRVPCVIHCVLCLYVLVFVCLCSCVLCLCVRVCSCVPFLCRLCPIDGVRTHSLIIVTTYLALCCVCGAWCWWCCAFNSARCAALLCVSRLAQLVAWAWINLLHCWRLCFAFAFEPRMMWLGLLTFESGLNAGYATLCLSCGAARVQASMMDGLDWTDQTVNSAVVQENWVRMN